MAFMQIFVKGKVLPYICIIIFFCFLAIVMPASASASLPTIDSVISSTTNVVNGGDVIFTISGTSETNIVNAWTHIKNPQGTSWSISFPVTKNGNQWTGQYTYNIPQSAQSGQYILHRITVKDDALNTIDKDYNIIVNVDNSANAQPATIDSVTSSTTNVVNGGDVIFTISGTSKTNIVNAWTHIKNPQGTSWSISFPITKNGNQWTGQYTYTIPQSAQSGQYILHRITVKDDALNTIDKDYNVIINVDNSANAPTSSPTTMPVTTSVTTLIPTSTTIQTTLPTTIPVTTSGTTSIPTSTTIQTTLPTTIPVTTSVTTPIPTTSLLTIITTVQKTETTSPVITAYTNAVLTISPTKTITRPSITQWPTDTPSQSSPLGLEIGIIATIGIASITMKRK